MENETKVVADLEEKNEPFNEIERLMKIYEIAFGYKWPEIFGQSVNIHLYCSDSRFRSSS